LSIHPCRHHLVMKRLVDKLRKGNLDHAISISTTDDDCENIGDEIYKKEFPVENALILFLKFISSAIPTIEVDMTNAM